MENGFNYQSVPNGYIHCFNKECSRSNECMRHLVAKHCSATRTATFSINPNCIPENTDTCTHFHEIKKIRVAWGIKHLFSNLPYKVVASMKSQIINHFGRSEYYRIYRKEHGLSPENQNYIRWVFRNKEFPFMELILSVDETFIEG